jgi:hypothetical protein
MPDISAPECKLTSSKNSRDEQYDFDEIKYITERLKIKAAEVSHVANGEVQAERWTATTEAWDEARKEAHKAGVINIGLCLVPDA